MLRIAAAAAAIAFIPTWVLALSPGTEQQGRSIVVLSGQVIDSCYKKCVLEAKDRSRKYACLRICNAKPQKKCEDKCWLKHGNDSRARGKCLSRCS